MAEGLRVVRGPDWSHNNDDGGEGHVGTVVQYGSNGTAQVIWDNGNTTWCRIGQNGKHDLRVLDNATVGVRHTRSCDGCAEGGILGTRWKCTKCDDIDLCSVCYVTDNHDLTHRFQRIEAFGVEPVEVAQRNCSTKLRAMGVYPGATVVRGKHWEWGNQDGGAGKHGTVTGLETPDTRSARSTVTVKWASGGQNSYRVGHKGKVDVKYVEDNEAPGPDYYYQHLSLLDATNTKFTSAGGPGGSSIKEGDKVFLDVDQSMLSPMTSRSEKMSAVQSLRGQIAVVSGLSQSGELTVRFGSQEYKMSANVLKKIPELTVGDMVKICDDEDKLKAMQEEHGEWVDDMRKVLGLRGTVAKIDEDGDVVVKFGGKVYVFNPACCELDDGDEEEIDNSDDDDNDDDDDDDGELGAGLAQLVAGLALMGALHSAEQQSTGPLLFVKAIIDSDVAAVRSMVQNDAGLVNSRHQGIPMLHVAVHQGSLEITKLLIGKGANINTKDVGGNTALVVTIDKEHEDVAEYLIRSGADVNLTNPKGRSPAHCAAYENQAKIVRVLIARDCDINAKDVDGDTPLHDAVMKGHSGSVEALLTSAKINLKVSNNNGFTPIHVAAMKNHTIIVEKLLKNDRSLLNLPKDDGFSPLHLAAFNDNTDVVKILIRNKAQVNLKANDGETALHFACAKGFNEPVEALVNARGADVNLTDKDGDTPLHNTLGCTNTGAGDLMLQLLFDAQPRRDEDARIRIATNLLTHGAKLNIRNNNNKTPLDVCSSENIKSALASFNTPSESRPMSLGGPILCSNCYNRAANAVFLPCAHKDTCTACCKSVRQCGVCHKDVKSRVDENGKKVGDDCVIQ